MPRRLRVRDRLFWPHWPYCHWHPPFWAGYGPPPWWGERPSLEQEKEYLENHIEMLKEEIKEAEKELKELNKE